MAQVRLSKWTKDQLDQIKDQEDHSSLDSVVKTLLAERDHE